MNNFIFINQMDYQKAIQNLTDVLIDDDRFNEVKYAIFSAVDAEN